MKTLEEFKEFYRENLLPKLVELEKLRKKKVRQVCVRVVPIVVLTLLLFGATFSVADGDSDLPMFVVFLGFAAASGVYYMTIKSYVANFKGDVIRDIVQFLHSELHYDGVSRISREEFDNSRIFLNSVNDYDGDDRVRGKYGSTELDFSEIHAKYVSRDSKGRTTTRTVFKGLFFIADFHKHFHGETYVLTDRAEKSFGGFGKMLQSWNQSRPELVKMEDPEFEKLFVVYSTDQVESRYILSTSMISRLTEFRKETGRQVQFSFVDSKVYVAVNFARNLMEPRIFKTIIDFQPMQEYYEDLTFAIGIVDDLNLNTRIWSKQ